MPEEFVCEAIEPGAGTFGSAGAAAGGPGMPRAFAWRGENYTVAEVLDSWKETGPCSSGGAEKYVRRHCLRVRTECGCEMEIFFERKARSARERKKRWWLRTIKR